MPSGKFGAMRIVQSKRRVKFFGRLYPCHKEKRSDNYGFSVSEMAAADLRGGPVHVEHSGPSVGKITENWVDKEGYLCVAGALKSREKLERAGVDYEKLVRQLKNGELGEMSIHWRGTRDNSGEVLSESKRFVEATLTRKGFYDGCKVISVAASRRDSTDSETHRVSGEIVVEEASMEKPASEAEIMQIVEEHYQRTGVKIDPNELRGRDSLGLALYFTELSNKQEENAAAKFEQEKAKIMEQTSLSESQLRRLEQLEADDQRRREAYAKQNGERADSIFDLVKDSLPSDHHEEIKKALRDVATNPDLGLLFSAYDALAKGSELSTQRLSEAQKESVRARKDYQALRKEADEMRSQIDGFAQNQQAVEVASVKKRSADVGVDNDAKRQQMEKIANKSGETVTETASKFEMWVNNRTRDATAAPAYLDQFGGTAEKQWFNTLQAMASTGDLHTPFITNTGGF